MHMLKTPSGKLAERILTDVAYEHRIEGFRLRERAGILPATLYSFGEIVGFLSDSFPRIDFQELTIWIRDIIEDPELADEIERLVAANGSDLEKTKQIRDLMGLRIIQCKKIA
jgi:hypothetical protein